MGVFGIAPWATAAGPEHPNATIEVEFRDELLTLRASDAPLGDVIRVIGDAAGFETIVHGQLEQVLTRSMTAVPLEDALHRLLRNVSNVMFFEDARASRLSEVQLFGTVISSRTAADAPSNSENAPVIVRSLDTSRAEKIDVLGERAQQGDLLAIQDLSALLHDDEDPKVRSQAARALGRTGDAASVASLRTGVQDSVQMVRLGSIRALAAIKSDQSTQVLADVLFSHSDTRTRLLAVWALGEQDTPLARSYLQAAKADGDGLVQKAIARSRPSRPSASTDTDDNAQPADSSDQGSVPPGRTGTKLFSSHPETE